MQVIIMRGIPGSGKSTYVERTYTDAVICSADDFFVGKDGIYRFNAKRIQEAHNACWLSFAEAMKRQESLIVIDNTSIGPEEVGAYWLPAIANGYKVRIVTVECPLNVAVTRNPKAVDPSFMGILYERLRITILPTYWDHVIISGY